MHRVLTFRCLLSVKSHFHEETTTVAQESLLWSTCVWYLERAWSTIVHTFVNSPPCAVLLLSLNFMRSSDPSQTKIIVTRYFCLGRNRQSFKLWQYCHCWHTWSGSFQFGRDELRRYLASLLNFCLHFLLATVVFHLQCGRSLQGHVQPLCLSSLESV